MMQRYNNPILLVGRKNTKNYSDEFQINTEGQDVTVTDFALQVLHTLPDAQTHQSLLLVFCGWSVFLAAWEDGE